MKKTTLISSVLIALILVLGAGLFLITGVEDTATGRAVHSEPTEVKIGYRGHLFYLPAYVAHVRNYYAEQGLDVELVEFDSTNQLVEAVLSGSLDAAVGGVNSLVLLTIEAQTPGLLEIFTLGYYRGDFDALLVAEDSDIESIHDLEGKTISSLPGSTALHWMNKMLEAEGLTDKVTIVQTAPAQQLAVLESGSADAVFVLEPLITIAEEESIGRVLVESPIATYFQPDMLFETSVFSTEFVQEEPDTAKKIVMAVNKAIEFIDDNPETARSYYSEFTPVDDTIEEKLSVPEFIPSYAMDADAFQQDADRFAEAELIPERVDVTKMFYSS